MSGRISEHIRSNVVGYVALFFALAGGAYAVDGPLPGQNQVGSEDIINGEVITDDISDTNGVRSADVRDDTLNNGGLQAVDLRADSVGSSEVAPDAIGSGEVAPDSLGALDLAPDSVGSSEVAVDAVGAGEVAPDSLGQQDLAVASVTSSEVGTDAIGSAEVATGAIGSSEIVDEGVGNPDLGANSVNGSNVFPSSLTGADILANSLSSSDVGPDAVGSSEVANGSLTTGEFASSIPAARVTRTSGQGITHATFTTLNFNSERYDTSGMHSTASNLSRIIAPVDGIYLVTAQIEWDASGAGTRILRLLRNGSTTLARDDRLPGTDRFNQPIVNLSTVASFSAGDFVEADVLQDSGGNLSILRSDPSIGGEFSPELSMTWLAPGP
jgi:microcompartment protein CcmK/EutM